MTKNYILAADDEPMNLLIFEELLEDEFELVCVESGLACLKEIKKRQPDLILMDVNMPEIDGLEACRQIKAASNTASIPIVMVSALATDDEIRQGLSAGADSYLTKPFSERDLKDTINLFLD